MTDITLRDYLKNIDDYIKQNRLEEATAHSAHILQRFPKNAAAYRLLGRALMELKRYEEAGEVFRRLLGAVPDDFAAHFQLSIVYDELKQPNEALWHVERAFDQQSGNPTVNERLRALYKKYRNVDVQKIQLTAGAVANQYIASGMQSQAIEILQRTLQKMPDRNDLKLKLARALWQNGQRVDAAETAIEVLKVHPYALDANRILTELWLEEDRPSDAQRYLSRIEDVDPYQAMQLATGKPVTAETFKMQELDFKRYAAALTASETPDWLDSLNVDTATAPAPTAKKPTPKAEPKPAPVDDDWLADIAAEQTPPAAKKKVTDDLSNLLPDDFGFPDSAGIDDTVTVDDLPDFDDAEDIDELLSAGSKIKTGSLTGMLAKLGGDEKAESEAADEDDDWLREIAASNMVSGSLNTNDLESLLDDTEEMTVDDLLGNNAQETGLEWLDDDSQDDASDLDPLAWLNESGADIGESDAPVAVGTHTDDALAWLNESDIEFDDDAEVVPTLFDENDPVVLASKPKNPMAWLEETDVEYEGEDIVEVDDTSNLSYYEKSQTVDDEAIAHPMAWLADADAELADDDIFAPDTDDAQAEPGMDWLSDDSVLDEMLDLHDLTDNDNSTVAPAPASTVDDAIADDLFEQTDWQDTMTDQPDWNDEEFSDEEESLDDLDWLSDDDLMQVDDLEPAAEADADTISWLHDADTEPDKGGDIEDPLAWLNAESPTAATADDELITEADMGDPIAWLADAGIDMDEEEEPVEDNLDWMNELDEESDAEEIFAADEDLEFDFEEESDAVEVTPMVKSGMLDFLSTSDSEESIDWTGDIQLDDVFAEEEADWLSAIGGTDNEEDEEATELDWMSEVGAEESEYDAEPVAENVDWMSSLTDDNDDEEDLEAEPVVDGMDWMSDLSNNEDELEEEPVADAEIDWMADLSDEEVEEEPVAESMGWMSSLTDDDNEELEEAEPVADAEIDWMSDLSDDEELEEKEPVADAEIDWMADLSDNEELEEAEPVADGMDWMSDLSDDEELEEAKPVADAEIDWMADLSDNEEEEEFEAEPVVDAEIDWMSDLSDDELEEEPIADTEIDWMSDLSDDEELEEEEPIGETIDDGNWLSEEADDEMVAESTSDWGLDFESDDSEEYVATGMTGLLNTIREKRATDELDDATGDMEIDTTGAFDNEPDWLGALDSSDAEEEIEAEPVAASTSDWGMSFADDEDDEMLEGMPLAETDTDFSDFDDEDELEAVEAIPFDEADTSFSDFDDEDEYVAEEAVPLAEAESLSTFDDEPEFEAAAEAIAADFEDYEEELEFARPDNAPDWLNAMVPGLDLDYAAEEDEPVESEYAEASSHRQRVLAEEAAAATSDFTWLQAIVDTETGVKPSSDRDETDEPVARPSLRRFIFSKLPAWMRGGGGETATPAATVVATEAVADAGVPDYLADFDDFDAPDDNGLDDDFDDLDDDFEFDDDFDKQ
jgi:tetratricopeptide (TPR) repeat protein